MSKVIEMLGGYQAMERRNLQETSAQFESPEIARSFPPPNHQLEASTAHGDAVASGETVVSEQANGQSFQSTAQAKAVAPRQQAAHRHYESSASNTWERDVCSATGQRINYYDPQDAQNRALFIQYAGEWEEAKVFNYTVEGKKIYFVMKKGRRTVSNFIRLVQKLEAAYPQASPAEITEMLRSIGGYDDVKFQTLLGKKSLLPKVQPKGGLTQADIDILRAMMAHGDADTKETERGVARDHVGENVAMGHVITGMAAGYNPQPNVDPRNAYTDLTTSMGQKATLAKMAGVGSTVNNLYAVTIAGDLGQSAVVKDKAHVDANADYIGDHTEATIAELVGDVDGFNIGDMLQRGKLKGLKVSTILNAYFKTVGQDSTSRWTNFQAQARELRHQTIKFADNYRFTSNGRGFEADLEDHIRRATNQFNGLVSEYAGEQPKRSKHDLTQKRMTIRTQGSDLAFLSANANNYKGSRIASLANGTKVCPINPGDRQFFNLGLEHREVYGFTYCMVMTGGYEGQIGWVSNSFLRPN